MIQTGVEGRGDQKGNMFVQNRVSGSAPTAIISHETVHFNGNVTT
ncbi:MAG: hypothetical protein ACKVHE_20020 [Planctomycetales bacterium]